MVPGGAVWHRTPIPADVRARWGRPVAVGLAVSLLALTLPTTIGIAAAIDPAVDFLIVRDAAARWLAGGSFYEPWQLAGPYHLEHGAILYPPIALWLFAPFTVLPAVLWWITPAAIVAWSAWRLRPGPLTWPILAALVGFSPLPVLVQAGNPSLWIIAAAWAGAATVGPAVLILAKPSLAPFALFGVWRRRWWLWAVAFAMACLPFGVMWADWLRVITDSDGSVIYSFREYGLMATAGIAWAGRRR
jgi:hypothetical protein